MRATARFIAVASLALGLGSCKSAPQCPVQPLTDAGAALQRYDARRGDWTTLKAEARVTQWGDRSRIRGTVLMFLARPNRIRFDVMSAVGPVAVLTSDGESFQLSDLREGTFLQGPTCPENIARLLGVSVPAEDVVQLLTGAIPRVDVEQQSMECRDGTYVIESVGLDGRKHEIVFAIEKGDVELPPDQQRLLLRRWTQRNIAGDRLWEADYHDYMEVDGQLFPSRVRFTDVLADTEVRVQSITLDPEVPDDAFRQTPAPGMSIQTAGCT